MTYKADARNLCIEVSPADRELTKRELTKRIWERNRQMIANA